MKKVFQKQNPLIKIGKVVQAHALKGEVKVHVFSQEAPWLKKLKSITLGERPFEIEKKTWAANGLILKLKGIDDRNAAEGLRGVEVSISDELLRSKEGENLYLREILGFKLVSQGEEVGKVEGFESNSAQDLLIVALKASSKKALVPLVRDFLVKIDFQNQEIHMSLPPGILEVNHAL